MLSSEADLSGLNFLLHQAEIVDLAFDPSRRLAVLTIAPTTLPKAGPAPASVVLSLSPISALAVTLQDPDGNRPIHGMEPVGLDELNRLLQHVKHPLAGFDFVDSGRNSTPKGMIVFEWSDPGVRSRHTLSFFFGLRNQHDEAALLVFLILFDRAELRYPNGEEFPIALYRPVGAGWKAITWLGQQGKPGPVRVLPDPASPSEVDRQLVALIFADKDSEEIISFAVGRASWDGRHLRWLAPDGVIYDVPDQLTSQIRPRLPDMSHGSVRLDGFDYFVTLPIRPSDPRDAKRLVRTCLKRSWSFGTALRLWQR